MKQCPACRAELPDDASSCVRCGGWWLPDGSFHTSWEEEMARATAARTRKLERAERLGRLGRPLPLWFLDGRPGCGTLAVMAAASVAVAAVAVLA